jgi:predicted nucleic acid-binding Zn ribbon protein
MEKQKQERIQKYNENPLKCIQCSTIIPYEKRLNKFCNRSCAASYNDTKFPKRSNANKLTHCIFCGTKLNDQFKYCNHQCEQNYKWEIKKQQIIQKDCKHITIKTIKKYVLELQKHKCCICGITEWQGQPVPLVLDHIDGHSENNDLTNLRLVCGNCDMQLPTYKSKNKGNGRAKRRQRYADGLSY